MRPRSPRRHGPRWAGPWVRALERMRLGRRQQQGLHYARTGRVVKFEVRGSEAVAAVQGSVPVPYEVRYALAPLAMAQWDTVIAAIARRPDFTTRLLNEEMPYRIEEAFREVRVPLFPGGGRDVRTSCTCPDGAQPCKHVAAVHYVLSQQVEENPFLLFQLRGRDKEQVLHALRLAGAAEAQAAGPAGAPTGEDALTADPVLFWKAGPKLEGSRAENGAWSISGGTFRRLGTPPFGDDTEAIESALRAAWESAAVSAAAQLRK